MAYERGKKTYAATTVEAVVAIGKTRRLKPAETNVVIKHVFDSLGQSAKSFKPWNEAWAIATSDGIEKYANYLKPTAKDTYLFAVPECLIEQRAMRDMRDALNGRKKPRGEPRRICKCSECRRARATGTPRA